MGPKERRLSQLAAPLEPERPPFYVRHPVTPALERTFQAEGWYWVPPGHHVAVYLASNFEAAAYRLRQEQHYDDAA